MSSEHNMLARYITKRLSSRFPSQDLACFPQRLIRSVSLRDVSGFLLATDSSNLSFLPESPRYLYARGQEDKAVQILAKLHSRTQDPNSPLIQLELQEITEAISLDGADRKFWNVKELFNTRAARYRAGLCFLVSVGGQLSGERGRLIAIDRVTDLDPQETASSHTF